MQEAGAPVDGVEVDRVGELRRGLAAETDRRIAGDKAGEDQQVLVRIVDRRIARIADPIAIAVELLRIREERADVARIGDAITILVVTDRGGVRRRVARRIVDRGRPVERDPSATREHDQERSHFGSPAIVTSKKLAPGMITWTSADGTFGTGNGAR
jgi:hypothetical protein